MESRPVKIEPEYMTQWRGREVQKTIDRIKAEAENDGKRQG